MHRTQIYLTQKEKDGLNCLMHTTGKSMASLIREALDTYLEHKGLVFENMLIETQGCLEGRNFDIRQDWEVRDERLI